jgi:hypothetical protein
MSSRREFPALGNPCLVACQIGENSMSDLLALQRHALRRAIILVESEEVGAHETALAAELAGESEFDIALALGRADMMLETKLLLKGMMLSLK